MLHYHYATLPYRNTLKSAARKALYPQWSMTRPSVFLYGRTARERSEFYGLKVRCFTLKLQSQFGATGQNRTGKPKRQILSLLCLPISPQSQIRCGVSTHSHFALKSACPRLFYWCLRRDSNSQNLASKTNTYTNSVTEAIYEILLYHIKIYCEPCILLFHRLRSCAVCGHYKQATHHLRNGYHECS